MKKKAVIEAIAKAQADSNKSTWIKTGIATGAGFLAATGAYLLGKHENNKTTEQIDDINSRLTTTENDVKTIAVAVNEIAETLNETTKSPKTFNGYTAVSITEARRLKNTGSIIYVYDDEKNTMAPVTALFIGMKHYVQVGGGQVAPAPAAPVATVDPNAPVDQNQQKQN